MRNIGDKLGLIITCVILVPSLIFAALTMTTDLGLSYQLIDEGIQITHKSTLLMSATDRVVSYSEITGYELRETLSIKKSYGLNNFRALIGSYTSEELGKVTAYINNQRSPRLVLWTEDEIIVLSPAHPETFVEALAQHTQR